MEDLGSDRLIVRLDEVSSTNSELKRLQQKGSLPEGSMVVADYQSAGRGQMGNSWFSNKGENILLSLLLYPRFLKAKNQFLISQIVSLAIKRVLDQYINDVSIKWPNDIYWNDQKIAGILIENSLMRKQIEDTIVGIGLNVNEEAFPAHLPNPVSLKQIVGKDIDREVLLKSLHKALFQLYAEIKQGNIKQIEQNYMQCLYRRNGMHWFVDDKERFRASIKEILPTGHLVLTTTPQEEERVYAFKEVTFVVENNPDKTVITKKV